MDVAFASPGDGTNKSIIIVKNTQETGMKLEAGCEIAVGQLQGGVRAGFRAQWDGEKAMAVVRRRSRTFLFGVVSSQAPQDGYRYIVQEGRISIARGS